MVQYKTAVSTVKDVNVINANAWVQTAINIARNINTKPFDEEQLKASITEIRSMTVEAPEQFVGRLQREQIIAFIISIKRKVVILWNI